MIDIRKPHWVAVYTKSRNEKKVYQRLQEEGVEAFLPLQKRLKKWSDRKKWVEEPLLRSYIFVRITEKEYYHVLKIFGVVKYVTFEGKAAPIPDKQIDILKMLIGHDVEIETLDDCFEKGDRVKVSYGNFAGFEGELVEHRGKKKVIIRIDHILNALNVNIPLKYVTKIPPQN